MNQPDVATQPRNQHIDDKPADEQQNDSADKQPSQPQDAPPQQIYDSPARRLLYMSIGHLAVGLGILGAILPGLPTTVFLLMASYFYARSSRRFHSRLMNHKLLGPYLRNIQDKRAMPRRAKITSLIMLWGAIGYSSYTIATWWATALLIATAIGVSYIILIYIRTLETIEKKDHTHKTEHNS